MKKVLFIDRDGTLVIEPPVDKQLDSIEKLEFYPTVFSGLSKIASLLDYELVMVTNQDGLGTESFPEDTFWPAQNKVLRAFENEGIHFAEIFIDRSFPEDNALTRKPGTAMLGKYVYGPYDLANSFVIGDRQSDLQLAINLGAKGILIGGESSPEAALCTSSWNEIFDYLSVEPRKSVVSRETSETQISVELNLDGTGVSDIDTGLPFFDHMLEQIARHGEMDLIIRSKGDLEIDEHHTIEDVALALGAAFKRALGSKKGIERYGFLLPMDDCLAQVAIDFGGRPWLVWDADFKREKIGDMPTEMFMHFFKSFSDAAACNLNIKAEGENEHHKIEAIFKGLAKAIKMAKTQNSTGSIPSTKGTL
ncbi:bifunctional histidinol-phosphatase/imidazoleglycerol-phosphate dehydratase HisB [Phaeocystidibacter luteus]|uniref:Histidine biosynthesis bifunctional protein HisB n=1 Tax=Phaeocystidibacter luteus TaxID=911197 RepID=A0A6N6RJR2_9FLAO|nr:bifunctional histidinol-phosphatase/imidazoleglycerol-phosphate dehydratase HisB [Phaeocystidibacter luteus]KAB2807732.1 bifunctional histidinol-phosphatase/imidazoleglycerol-phosphate dehydratase HisB [Phaeocystidibacter luteus]